MEWVKKLGGAVVGLDTAPLIYFVEEHPFYLPVVDPFFEAIELGQIQVVTSTLTLTEVLIHPFRQDDRNLVQQYTEILLDSRNLRTVPVSEEIAIEAAKIRAAYGLRAPDSIQLATARFANATALLTNDGALARVPGFQIIVLSRLLARP
jgi:predicted nucleic acid-binding protein